jgi:hypothetical protein
MSFESEYPRRLREMQQGGDSISGSDHLSGSSSRRRPEAPFNRRLSGHPVAITPVQAIWLLDSGLRRNDGQKPISAYATARLRVFEIIPDSSELSPG